MIKFENVSVKFRRGDREFTAVDKVSLNIRKGEFFGIVGPSGAGKSTLVRTINLLQRPQEGKILIKGEDITSYSGARLKKVRQNIGMIFQHFNLIKNATVFDNVAFALKASDTPKNQIEGRVKALLEVVGLKDKASLYPSDLSGGQKQRVAIARALSNNPEILLCDEATSALDPDNTAEVIQTLKNIKNTYPITIVFITHQMEVAKTLFDRIAVMDRGALTEVSDSYSLFLNPRSSAGRNLIAKSFENIIPNEVIDHEQDLYVITYREDCAYDPVISDISRSFVHTDLSIIAGNIEYIQDKPIGRLLISLRGGEDSAKKEVLSYLKTKAYIHQFRG